MRVYKIFKGGTEINRIVADESFCKSYCEKRGYTYELEASPKPDQGEDSQPADELEKLRAEVATLQANTAPVMAAARAYAMTAADVSDSHALDMAELFPTWEDVLQAGAELAQGHIISKDGQLYRIMQTIVPRAHQVPGGEGMLAIYRPIDREHAGTPEDPIPWVYGMDCLAGLCYSYEAAVYRVADGGNMIPCVWPPDTPGLWQWEKVIPGGMNDVH